MVDVLRTENLSEVQGKVQVHKLKHTFIFQAWQFVAFVLLVILPARDILSMTKQEQKTEKMYKVIKTTIYGTWYFQLLEKSTQNYELQINTSMWIKTTFVPQQILSVISYSFHLPTVCNRELWLLFPLATFSVYFWFFCSCLRIVPWCLHAFPPAILCVSTFSSCYNRRKPSIKQWITPQQKETHKQKTARLASFEKVPVKSQQEVRKVMKLPQPHGKKGEGSWYKSIYVEGAVCEHFHWLFQFHLNNFMEQKLSNISSTCS